MGIMEVHPEVINIGNINNDSVLELKRSVSFDNIDEEISTDDIKTKKSTNFGGGLELLMNDKKRSNTNSSDIRLEDIDNLENELNDLTEKIEDLPKSNNPLKNTINIEEN